MAAGYKPKTEVDLAWDVVKKGVAARVNLEVGIYRARRTNELLTEYWKEFKTGLVNGNVLQLEPGFDTWVKDALGTVDAVSK